jgi:hypothetical protein
MTKFIDHARRFLGSGRLLGWAATTVVAYLLSSAAVSGTAQNVHDKQRSTTAAK